ncbi:unnamed protein product [Musa acuminata var. zebrina]
MGFAVLGGYLTPFAITFWDFFSVNSQLRVQFKRTPFICSLKGLSK